MESLFGYTGCNVPWISERRAEFSRSDFTQELSAPNELPAGAAMKIEASGVLGYVFPGEQIISRGRA